MSNVKQVVGKHFFAYLRCLFLIVALHIFLMLYSICIILIFMLMSNVKQVVVKSNLHLEKFVFFPLDEIKVIEEDDFLKLIM